MKTLLITALFITALTPQHMYYNAEGYKLSQFQENGGCSIDTCPEVVKGDFVPLSKLEHGSREYWRVYCNEMLDTKFECK